MRAISAKLTLEIIRDLLKGKGVSAHKMETDSGTGRSVVDNLKKGQMIGADKLVKLADYFEVTVDYLLGDELSAIVGTQIDKQPEISDEELQELWERRRTQSNLYGVDSQIKIELFGTLDVPDEVFEDVKKYAIFALNRHAEKQNIVSAKTAARVSGKDYSPIQSVNIDSEKAKELPVTDDTDL